MHEQISKLFLEHTLGDSKVGTEGMKIGCEETRCVQNVLHSPSSSLRPASRSLFEIVLFALGDALVERNDR